MLLQYIGQPSLPFESLRRLTRKGLFRAEPRAGLAAFEAGHFILGSWRRIFQHNIRQLRDHALPDAERNCAFGPVRQRLVRCVVGQNDALKKAAHGDVGGVEEMAMDVDETTLRLCESRFIEERSGQEKETSFQDVAPVNHRLTFQSTEKPKQVLRREPAPSPLAGVLIF